MSHAWPWAHQSQPRSEHQTGTVREPCGRAPGQGRSPLAAAGGNRSHAFEALGQRPAHLARRAAQALLGGDDSSKGELIDRRTPGPGDDSQDRHDDDPDNGFDQVERGPGSGGQGQAQSGQSRQGGEGHLRGRSDDHPARQHLVGANQLVLAELEKTGKRRSHRQRRLDRVAGKGDKGDPPQPAVGIPGPQQRPL